MENKKYKLGESIEFFGVTFYRVVALVAIPAHGVGVGDVGGWVQSEKNLAVEGNAWVEGNVKISKVKDYAVIGPIGSRSDWCTFAMDYVAVGCFCGTFAEFKAKVKETHGTSQDANEYMAALKLAELRFPKGER